ncbi:MAG: hypothetical protein HY046_10470 [Acidobacteria bacterium]|nr:hypothetical protein [Acidobacteriota bacterium]
MALTREQLQLRGRETSEKIFLALNTQKIIPHFVDDYVSSADRRGLRSSPLRYRELLTTLYREALLALAVYIHGGLAAKMTRRKTGLLRGEDADNAAAFQEEFFRAVASKMQWTASDAEEFTSDFELCRHLEARMPRAIRPRRAGESSAGPLVERCALLLDPSMIDKAQRAASQLQEQLEKLAQTVLAAVFRPRRKD